MGGVWLASNVTKDGDVAGLVFTDNTVSIFASSTTDGLKLLGTWDARCNSVDGGRFQVQLRPPKINLVLRLAMDVTANTLVAYEIGTKDCSPYYPNATTGYSQFTFSTSRLPPLFRFLFLAPDRHFLLFSASFDYRARRNFLFCDPLAHVLQRGKQLHLGSTGILQPPTWASAVQLLLWSVEQASTSLGKITITTPKTKQ